MDWKKIVLKLVEEEKDCKDTTDIMRKFSNFQIIYFTFSERNNDMSQVLTYFVKHSSQHAFYKLFNTEVKMVEPAN